MDKRGNKGFGGAGGYVVFLTCMCSAELYTYVHFSSLYFNKEKKYIPGTIYMT